MSIYLHKDIWLKQRGRYTNSFQLAVTQYLNFKLRNKLSHSLILNIEDLKLMKSCSENPWDINNRLNVIKIYLDIHNNQKFLIIINKIEKIIYEEFLIYEDNPNTLVFKSNFDPRVSSLQLRLRNAEFTYMPEKKKYSNSKSNNNKKIRVIFDIGNVRLCRNQEDSKKKCIRYDLIITHVFITSPFH